MGGLVNAAGQAQANAGAGHSLKSGSSKRPGHAQALLPQGPCHRLTRLRLISSTSWLPPASSSAAAMVCSRAAIFLVKYWAPRPVCCRRRRTGQNHKQHNWVLLRGCSLTNHCADHVSNRRLCATRIGQAAARKSIPKLMATLCCYKTDSTCTYKRFELGDMCKTRLHDAAIHQQVRAGKAGLFRLNGSLQFECTARGEWRHKQALAA